MADQPGVRAVATEDDDLARRLKRGDVDSDASLDLHGRTQKEARGKLVAFLEEARKLNVPVKFASWQEVETMLRDVYATPQPVVERAAKIINDEK